MGLPSPFSGGGELYSAVPYDPAGVFSGTGAAGGEYGETAQMLADPMDLFGHRASQTQDEITAILTQSAQAGIAQQEEQEKFLQDRYQPYYEQGVGALGKLSSLYTGEGDSGYKPSALYEYQKEKGLEGITAQQSKLGLRESSATAERESGLVSGLASEDINRYAGGLLSQVQMGAGSAEAMSAASSAVSGNIGSLYGALGSGLNTSRQAYGQARQASLSTAGNTLSNLGAYMGQQG